ncbi:hypothetical protein LXA43DRAFT_1046728 [Ganoderma leucocontextum]|nr:hypothetical protein LXA43DRAFT_1046728 [Ganoderma leucocontextum]
MFPETSRRADFAITAGILARTSEADGSRSPPIAESDDESPIPEHDGTTSLSPLGTGTSGLSYDNRDEHQQPSNVGRAPNVLPVQTSQQHVEIAHWHQAAVSHTTTTPLYTFSHGQPWTSASAVPNPSPWPVHQQPPWHGPVQSSTFVGPSSPIQGQTPHVFDNPTAFSPRYYTARRADSQQILASSSDSPSEYAASSEELRLELEREGTSRAHPWAGFSSEDTGMPASDALLLQLAYGDVGGGRIYENINDAATALAAGLDLRAISEAWMSGLRAAADAQPSG